MHVDNKDECGVTDRGLRRGRRRRRVLHPCRDDVSTLWR